MAANTCQLKVWSARMYLVTGSTPYPTQPMIIRNILILYQTQSTSDDIELLKAIKTTKGMACVRKVKTVNDSDEDHTKLHVCSALLKMDRTCSEVRRYPCKRLPHNPTSFITVSLIGNDGSNLTTFLRFKAYPRATK